jgi:hypothetical protein
MTTYRNLTSLTLALGALIIFVVSCGGLTAKKDEPPPTPVPSSSSSPTTAKSPSTSEAKDIAGEYDVTGTNEGTGTPYRGSLKVEAHDAVYRFMWDSGGRQYDGVGVKTDSAVAVAFTSGDTGKGCGVILYKIGADGTLDGKAGYWGQDTSESETAKRTSGSDLEGNYDISGKNTAGKEYKGKLAVKKNGEGYDFTWSAGITLEGFGVRQGDTVAVGFGGKQCGFVSYEVASDDGAMIGKWGSSGSKTFGTETARKK